MKSVRLVVAGCVALAFAVWLATRNSGTEKQAVAAAAVDGKPVSSAMSGSPENSEAGTGPRAARPRPPVKESPRLFGEKITVLEGHLDEHGSEEPVTFRLSDGTVVSAHRLVMADDGSIVLIAPLRRVGVGGEGMRMQVGEAVWKADGTLTSNGIVRMMSASGSPDSVPKPLGF